MRPLLALAKCSGTAPFRLLRPPYCRANVPTPMFCLMYTFLAREAAAKMVADQLILPNAADHCNPQAGSTHAPDKCSALLQHSG